MIKFRTLVLVASLTPFAVYAQGAPGGHFIENWDLDQDGAVTVAEATEKRGEVFFMFDADENGELDAAEYAEFDATRAADLQANGGGMGKGGNRLQEGMSLGFNDVDSNGTVSKDEFVSRSADWIAKMDRDGDGVITTSDFGPGKG